MIDPLSTIASVVAVSTAALQSAQILLHLIDGIRNAPDEIAAISNDTHAFYDIVASLEASLKDNGVVSVVGENNAMVAMVANIELPLRNCSATLGQLMLKVQGHIKPLNDGKGSKFTTGAQWYFRKKNVRDLLDRLGQNKATLNAAPLMQHP
ncbi:hypothetical protein LPUS_03692 [Lasallia pustulata]|uniref:Azaphilone pigments biosynthesis cluster protein L N-terminal domain-containing protein n=1 Tax=Lasallia pustulata TaxID=136370 RepID=A0A1W5CV96_9LECA|nr:hypothetical protein LPUS_03692 [Lasallia pustulata]